MNLALFLYFSVIWSFVHVQVFCLPKNYCGPEYCSGNKQHTLCQYQSPKPADRCLIYEKTLKTEKDKQDLLHKINTRRNKVAMGEIRSLPSAENMHKLVWNKELEIAAQRWADQCFGQNHKDACRDLGEAFVGQNIATIYGESPGLIPAALADVWYMELLNVNRTVINRYQPLSTTKLPSYDSFTQLVWADTKQVGCGGVKFKGGTRDLQESKNKTVYKLVCNFFPGGNRIEEPVYRDGVPCSRCPLGTCDIGYRGLCDSYLEELHSTVEVEYTELESVPSTLYTLNATQLRDSMSSGEKRGMEENKNDFTDQDDEYNPLNLFSYSQKYTRPNLSTTIKTTVPCKESFAVDELVEIIKHKLMNDSVFKEAFATKPFLSSFSDPSVAAFANQIYSKDEPSTTLKYTQKDVVNSTLLADLIEAVMFRHGVTNTEQEKHKSINSYNILKSNYNPEVSPVKIQAELSEIKLNSGFTGHFFFPEDELENGFANESESEPTETYDDPTGFPISDLLLEIEDLKKDKATTNFLDEILDSDFDNESETTTNTHILKQDAGFSLKDEDFLDESKIIKRSIFQNVLLGNTKQLFKRDRNKQNKMEKLKDFKRKLTKKLSSKSHLLINYNHLLKQLVLDLKALNPNEIVLHCSQNFSHRNFLNNIIFTVYFFYCCMIFGSN